jgi:hypothetical protein
MRTFPTGGCYQPGAARPIADPEGRVGIKLQHIAETIGYRSLDQDGFRRLAGWLTPW